MSDTLTTGRAVPAELLYSYTFAGTGRTVNVRKLSALIRDEVRRVVQRDVAFTKPEPPLVSVDYGTGTIEQPHTGHPVYIERLADWQRRVNSEVGDRLTRLVVRRAVVCDVDTVAVATARADMLDIGVDLDSYTDHEVFVRFVCVGPNDDWVDLLRVVFERSAPSAEAVQAHVDSFRADVRGEAALPPKS